ncbi:hypothetical protein D3C75_983770 [compost metagenome]
MIRAKSVSLNSYELVALITVLEGLALTVRGFGSGTRAGRVAIRGCTSRVMTMIPSAEKAGMANPTPENTSMASIAEREILEAFRSMAAVPTRFRPFCVKGRTHVPCQFLDLQEYQWVGGFLGQPVKRGVNSLKQRVAGFRA